MAMGGYVEKGVIISSASTPASTLYIHGSGAAIAYPTGSGEGSMLDIATPTTVRNLEFSVLNGTASSAIQVDSGPVLLEGVKMTNAIFGISASGDVTAHDLIMENVNFAITVTATGKLTIDRAQFRHGVTAITSTDPGGFVNLTNVLIWGTSNLAMDLSASTGSISSTTIADSGADWEQVLEL